MRVRNVRKDLVLLQGMADRANELLVEFHDLSPEEREYATDLVLQFEKWVDAFRSLLPPKKRNPFV